MCFGDGVLFVERANESSLFLCLSGFAAKAKGNQVLIGRLSVFPRRERARDPKPSELAMARVNSAEMREEARTREPFNTLG
jgi:hypothetical protein